MPRTLQEILDQADKLADQFEAYEPKTEDERDPADLVNVRKAVAARSRAEHDLVEAVLSARDDGYSWSAIGAILGTSGEAARQRYGQLAKH